MIENLKVALSYAERGFHVFPVHSIFNGRCTCNKENCTSPGKHPIPAKGFNAATRDTIQIKKWWSKRPNANIGVRTGKESNILVIDIDISKGDGEASLKEMIKEIGELPPTLEQKTGSGGHHLIYEYPSEHKIKTLAGIEENIDIRNDGGYIVAPPSTHISGNKYEWINTNPILKLSESWIKRLEEGKREKKYPSTKDKKNDKRSLKNTKKDKFFEGSRNDAIFKYGIGLLHNDSDESRRWEKIRKFNEENCNPPLDETELKQIANSISTYENGNNQDLNKYFNDTKYLIKNGKLSREKQTNGEVIYFPLGNFIPVPIEEITKDNSLTISKSFKFIGRMDDGEDLPEIEIPEEKFHSMQWVINKWGLKAGMSPGQNIKEYYRDAIQIMARKIKQTYVYTYTGWKKVKDDWFYLFNNGSIGAKSITVQLDGVLSNFVLTPPNDVESALKASYDLLNVAEMNITIPLMAMTYLSPLNESLRHRGIEPAFVLYVLGTSGSKKSTLTALFLNHFGEAFHSKMLPSSFKDTSNSVEKQGFILKDILSVLDDYHPATIKQEQDKMDNLAQSVVRAYGDRTSRGRLNSDTSLKEKYPPRGNLIITGENLPNIGVSGFSRMFIVNLEKDSINIDKLTTAQNKKYLLNKAMYIYIEWLISQMSNLENELAEEFYIYRNEAQKNKKHSRTPENIAWLQIGFKMYCKFILDYGVINENEFNELCEKSWEVFTSISGEQALELEEEKPTYMFLSAINELLSSGRAYALFCNTSPSNEVSSKMIIGYEDDDYYYFYPEIIYSTVHSFYKEQGKYFSTSKNMLNKSLAKEGIIVVDSKGKKTCVKWFNGTQNRYLVVIKDRMNEILGKKDE